MSARDEVLGRVRDALGEARAPAARSPAASPSAPVPGDADLFAERVADYRAVVTRSSVAEVPTVLAERLAAHGARRVVVPEGFPREWTPDGLRPLRDEPPLSAAELDGLDGVLTTAALGIAESGTLVLDHGPGQGRRALTLLPDLHLCVVREADVVATVASALTSAGPVTFISGPSATSDIELDRVEGVHGPRRLEVVLVR